MKGRFYRNRGNLASTCSFPKWAQWLRLSLFESRSLELTGLSVREGAQIMSHLQLVFQVIIRKLDQNVEIKVRSGIVGKETHARMICRRCRQRIHLTHHCVGALSCHLVITMLIYNFWGMVFILSIISIGPFISLNKIISLSSFKEAYSLNS